MAFVANRIFITKGVGKHRERLTSFELALRDAGIAACNIVRVSSIFPPNCKLISRGEGLKHIQPGQVDEIWGLAAKHGFALAPFFNDQGLCGDRIAALRVESVA